MQDSSVREMFGRRSHCWIAQALGLCGSRLDCAGGDRIKQGGTLVPTRLARNMRRKEAEKREENGSSNVGTT